MTTTISDFVAALIRTYVPILVGLIFNLLATAGIILPDDISAQLTNVLSFLFAAAWYLAARLLEKWKPNFGWLIGLPKIPEYVDPKTSKLQDAQDRELLDGPEELD